MSKTYVVPDLHGRYDLLQNFLSGPYDWKSKIVFLGDYIDRGPDSRAVLQKVRDLVNDGLAVALKGNHEDMMVKASWSRGGSTLYHWLDNGGYATMLCYKDYEDEALHFDTDWVASLPIVHSDAHRVYVHGWVNEALPLDKQLPQEVLWGRYGRGEEGGYNGKHVVHGHTPRKSVELFTGRTNLDIGAVFLGVLAVGVFDDDTPGGPIEILHVSND